MCNFMMIYVFIAGSDLLLSLIQREVPDPCILYPLSYRVVLTVSQEKAQSITSG